MKPPLLNFFKRSKNWFYLLVASASSLASATAQQNAGPEPSPMPPEIPAPQDLDFPGVINLTVDATDTTHGIFRVHETIPVAHAGPIVLLYPRWLPGHHSP